MTTTCTHQVALDFVGGGSDKIYVIQVQEEDLGGGVVQYHAKGYYGRRGSGLKEVGKYTGPSAASARAAADRLENEKRKGGYNTMGVPPGSVVRGMPASAPVFGGASSSTSTATAPARKPRVGPVPMLAEALDEAKAELFLASSGHACQIKYDGERAPVSLRRSGIVATNRKGEVRPLTAVAEAELKKLLALPDFSDERETVLDGELMGDVYVAYDLIMLRDNDMRSLSFEERYSALETLLEAHQGLLAPCAWTEAEKRALRARAEAEDMEGLMFRNIDAPYAAGRTSNLGKFKLWATCTCRVLTINAKRSVQLAMLDEAGVEVFVGNVTVPANQDIPEPDDLVEVRYLYAMEGGSLYQPTLLRVRDDIEEADKRSELRRAPPEKRGEPIAA